MALSKQQFIVTNITALALLGLLIPINNMMLSNAQAEKPQTDVIPQEPGYISGPIIGIYKQGQPGDPFKYLVTVRTSSTTTRSFNVKALDRAGMAHGEFVKVKVGMCGAGLGVGRYGAMGAPCFLSRIR